MIIRGVLLVLILSSLIKAQSDSVIISEIMFYPLSGNNEYIELYNLSSSQSVNLHNYSIRYYTSLPDTIISAGNGMIIPPNGYAVVMEGDYDFENGIYKNIIPSSALILKINNNSFGTNGMANTTSRPVLLYSDENEIINSRHYSADNTQAISDEKKLLVQDTSSVHWINSLIHNGTPGFRNSVMPYTYDLETINISILPAKPVAGDNVELSARVTNKGSDAAGLFTTKFYNDINYDSIPSSSELMHSEVKNIPSPSDTISISYTIMDIPAGDYVFISEVEYQPDEFTGNNIAYKSIKVGQAVPKNSVIINEIMYAPQNGQPEWIELYNNSDNSVNLENWGAGDALSAVYITTDEYILLPHSYVVLTKDSSIKNYYPFNYDYIEVSFPSLNNTGDAVVLYDSSGRIIDSLFYFPDWGGDMNRSLERIDTALSSILMENWTTSSNRYNATPGFLNSVVIKNNDASIGIFKTEKQYGIIGESVHFIVSVKNIGKNLTDAFDLSIYKDINTDSLINPDEIIRQFRAGEILPGDSLLFEFQYDGFPEGNNYFITKINYRDEDTCNNTSFFKFRGVHVNYSRNDIAINEIMYAPDNEPEWIEIINNSPVNINLKNFRIADTADSVYLIKSDYIFTPGSYLVISSDSILLQQRKIPSGFIKTPLPALNNTGETVILIDSLSRVIDSIRFSPEWGGKTGFSLERIYAAGSSMDSLNWGTSVNKYKGSPGYINSLSPKEIDAAVCDIITSPVYPVKGDTVYIFVNIKNRGSSNSEVLLNLYKDTDMDSLPDIHLLSSELIIQANDSILYNPGYTINNISSAENIFAEVLIENDEDTTNNYFIKRIKPGSSYNSVIINEVLYDPQNGEQEWIELYNNSNDTISLINWSIKDVLTNPASGIIKQDYFFLPHSYLILSSDSSLFKFHRIIPSDVLITTIPNLNNDADGVVITDDRNIAIDSMTYINKSDNNRSLERISPDASSLSLSNWGSPGDIELSTPGRINSIALKEKDIAAGGLYIDPLFPCLSDTINISASVRNFGMNICEGYTVSFLLGTADIPDSLLSIIPGDALTPGDSVVIYCPVKINFDRPIRLGIRINFTGDEDTINNYIERKVFPGEREMCVIINEIMYDPDEGGEWIEIYNPTEQTQNLKNWSISDILPSQAKNFITLDDVFMQPGEYIILAQDSVVIKNFPSVKKLLITRLGSLSSNGDGVIIFDYRDGIIDSVKYTPKWGGKSGRSLERKSSIIMAADSSNWTTSLSPFKATPGDFNSVSGLPLNKRLSLIINEIMYEPDIDNCEFIEFYNRSDENLNIGGWRIEDNSSYFIISDTSYIVEKNNYFVFAADSNIYNKYSLSENDPVHILGESSLGLSSSGEVILLKDINGTVIDSFAYSSKFHNSNYLITKNRSLERINAGLETCSASNWTTCTSASGATPCKENSVQIEIPAVSSGVVISPNPFSPDNDGWEDFAIINYSLRTEAPQLRIKIFDNTGRLVRTLADNTPSGSVGQVIFDGRDEEGRALRIGIYILFLEAAGNKGAEIYKTAFVIARKL